MLPGEDSPTNGDAFASARAKQEAGEHGSRRTAMPKWQWQGGAVKWANSTASAKCWVQCKHGAVCVQGFRLEPSAAEKQCECTKEQCVRDATVWWAVHERKCRAATLPPEEAEGSVVDCPHGGVAVGDHRLGQVKGVDGKPFVGCNDQQCKASAEAWWDSNHKLTAFSPEAEEHSRQVSEAATVAAGADMPMAVEEQAMHLLKRSAAGQEAMVWVAMSCDRCVPVDSVQHAEVQMAMNSHQLRWFWLCSYWTRAVAAGGEREFTRWFSFTENVWAQAEKQQVLAAKVEAKALGAKASGRTG